MKNNISRVMILMILLIAITGCKKDKISNPNDLAGIYTFYEIEEYATNKIESLPTPDGSTGKIVVILKNDKKEADVNLQSIEKGKVVAERTYHLNVLIDDDGDYSLLDKTTNKLAVFFIDDNEADIYFIEGFRISARK